MSIQIIQAKEINIPKLVPLLDGYRIFYEQPSDEIAVQLFLEERFKNKESVIFIALAEGEAAGFIQMYKSFSTVSLQPLLILNDLYVAVEYRNQGIGKALLLESQ